MTSQLRQIQARAIVFDAVGTLLRADPPVADVYHLAGWQHGSQLGRDEVGRRMRDAFAASEAGEGLIREATSETRERERWRRIVRSIFDDVPDSSGPLFRTLWQHFAEPQSWRLFDDVGATLGELAERGFRLAIASNFDRRLRAIVAADSALRRCEHCFISSEIGFPKPDGRFFAQAAALLDVPPNQILLVGDDWTNDILGARAAGWQVVWLNRSPLSPVVHEQTAGQSSEPSLQSLVDLLPLVER
jgi:haloacid dehalogenase superfamily, subfamily IA, variant 3 with third motif having DD or ED/haloacid dehalogenase superfamily, subfamily IA, variant 1 with third motif having Dx(3-4)D or Dx(3-4)E